MFTREEKKQKFEMNTQICLSKKGGYGFTKPWNLDDEIFYTWENQSENRHIHWKLVNNVNPIKYENK